MMRTEITNDPLAELDVDALILVHRDGDDIPNRWGPLDDALDGAIRETITSAAFREGKAEVRGLPTYGRVAPHLVVLAAATAPSHCPAETHRRAVASGVVFAIPHRCESIAVDSIPATSSAPTESEATLAAASAEAGILAAYRYDEYKGEAGAVAPDILRIRVADPDACRPSVEAAAVVADSTCWARDLVNMPPNAKRPTALADRAREMAQSVGLEVESLDASACRERGLNALLAVGEGSGAPPCMVVLRHGRESGEKRPVALVGKGITFDTGGISIKPSRGMHEMKSDMAGAAAVLGAMRAVATLGLPVHVVGLVPLAENMPGPDSYRPGDIVRSLGGKTIEVINTDAEGRLILADALAYANEHVDAAFTVDLATLTGACVVALGTTAAGLMSNDDGLAESLLESGARTGDLAWRLPLWPAYDKLIDSDVADVKNSGGRYAGAITAAKFLQRFAGDRPWAHIDIAGPAYLTKSDSYRRKGGTGYGVRLLFDWIQRRLESA